ncbi:hypothetical protein [Kitasatospora sp. NPDC091276]|uniref:hypothetical protein n=1 Tax=Kitasatospora sp. NPDC091276 TaxID=3155300 RepID=UPI00343D5369
MGTFAIVDSTRRGCPDFLFRLPTIARPPRAPVRASGLQQAAVLPAVRFAVRSAVLPAVRFAVRSAVLPAVRSAVLPAVRFAVRSAVLDSEACQPPVADCERD